MTLIEVIKSGKRFKRADWQDYFSISEIIPVNSSDVLAVDWHVEVPMKRISGNQIRGAVRTFNRAQEFKEDYICEFQMNGLIKELGLE